jgi:hypothetical protein
VTGYVRLANFKGDRDYGPEPGEIVVRIDREHACLGNQHFLANKADSRERDKVIILFERDLDLDEAVDGPMTQAILELALRVIAGEKIVLMCWCTPLACHGDVIVKRIRKKVELLIAS